MPQVSARIEIAAQRCVIWQEAYGYPGQANSYVCPLGPEPGKAWLLLTRKQIDEIEPSDRDGATLKFALYDLTEGKSLQSLEVEGMVFLRGQRMMMGKPDDENAVYLTEWADHRWWAWNFNNTTATSPGSFNVRMPSPEDPHQYYEQSRRSAGGSVSDYTWQTMLDNIWQRLPDSYAGLGPTLPYTPSVAPDGWEVKDCHALGTLAKMLSEIGCTIGFDPTDKTYSYVRLGQSQDEPDDLPRPVFDAEMITNVHAFCPRYSVSVFAKWEREHGTQDTTDEDVNWRFSTHSTQQTTISGTGSEGTKETQWHDVKDYLNSADRSARKQEFSDNLENDRKTPESLKRYSGIRTDQLPGPQVKVVLWRHWGDGFVTEVVRRPGVASAMRVLPDGRMDGQWKSIDRLQRGPDFGQQTFPVYPQLMEFITIKEGSPGLVTEPNADGLYDAIINRVGIPSYQMVWARMVDYKGSEDGNADVLSGVTRLGRMMGTATSAEGSEGSAERRPLYWIFMGSYGMKPVIEFELTATLTGNSSAAANITGSGADQYGHGEEHNSEPVTILNAMGNAFKGVSGDEGIAYHHKGTQYICMQIVCPPPP